MLPQQQGDHPMTTTISPSALVQAVRDHATNDPDRVYEPQGNSGCWYFPDKANTKGCIIGAALASLGVDTTRMTTDDAVTSLLEAGGFALDGEEGEIFDIVDYTEAQELWLGEVQARQDQGATWAAAVAKADEEVAL